MNPETKPQGPGPEGGDEKPYRVGTLRYDKAGLKRLFLFFLVGGLTYSLVYQIDPRVLPIILRDRGATNKQIAIIIGSLTVVLNSVIESVVAYNSDRARGKWGRRIPYIFFATPIVSLLILSIPFAPELTDWALRVPALAWLFRLVPWAPVITAFAVLIVAYKIFYDVVANIYLCLIADVVPSTHLGRFNTLFRVIGAISTFVGNYWLVGLAVDHGKEVLLGVAVVNLVGFMTICLGVREGDYPPIQQAPSRTVGSLPEFLAGVREFLFESFRHRIYVWTYITRVLIFAANAATPFVVFFAHDELRVSYDEAGKLIGISSLGWIVLAYPVGKMLDKFGSVRCLQATLLLGGGAYIASFFLISAQWSFLIASMVTNTLFWTRWSCEIMIAQELFDRTRMGQLGAANSIMKSVIIAFGTSPLTGAFLDRMGGYSGHLNVPLVGSLAVGGYRFIFLLLALIYFLAALALLRVRGEWIRLGGPSAYKAPGQG